MTPEEVAARVDALVREWGIPRWEAERVVQNELAKE